MAKFRTVLIIASCGVVLGAIMSAGMMDIARHGIMSPDHFTFCLLYTSLRRRGFSNETIQNIHEAYRLLYSKGILKEGIEEIKKNLEVRCV